jgi:hypothetical protein
MYKAFLEGFFNGLAVKETANSCLYFAQDDARREHSHVRAPRMCGVSCAIIESALEKLGA